MIKFTDIRRNANVLLGHEKETAIIKHSQVVGYIVPAARMNELLAAEEQYENGYMAQKDVSAIKAGDTVRIKSLKNTYDHYGTSIGILSIADVGLVADVFGSCVEIGAFKYHIDDLELVK